LEFAETLSLAGVDHFCLDLVRHGYDDISTLDEQMQRFASEVIPLLGRASPSSTDVVGDRDIP
jgi:hypothetical protein